MLFDDSIFENVSDDKIHSHQDEVVVLVMGAARSGKSSFIKTLTNDPSIVISHGSMPGTTDIQAISYVHQTTGRKIKIVDTPSFASDAGLTETEILKRITRVLLNLHYQGQKLNGLVYVQAIWFVRFSSFLSRSLRMFRSLCGVESFKNVVILTTFWDTLKESEGKTWEKKLRTKYFKELTERGAHFMQHNNTRESAEKVLRHVFTYNPTDVKIQKEMNVERKRLEETAVGSMHLQGLERRIKNVKKDIAELRLEIEEFKGVDPRLADELMREHESLKYELKKRKSERQDLKRGLYEEDKQLMWKQREDREPAEGLKKERTDREWGKIEMGSVMREQTEATESVEAVIKAVEAKIKAVEEAERQRDTFIMKSTPRYRLVGGVRNTRSTVSRPSFDRFHPYASPKPSSKNWKLFSPEVRRSERREKNGYSADETSKTMGIELEDPQKLAKEASIQMKEDAIALPTQLAPQLPSSALPSIPEPRILLEPGEEKSFFEFLIAQTDQINTIPAGYEPFPIIPSLPVLTLEIAYPTTSFSSELLKLIPRLNLVLRNDSRKEQLLDCRGDDAQRLLDSFQSLLDVPDLKIKFRSRLLLATRELAKRTGILPRCYELHDIKVDYEDDFVDSGGFADIFKCNFQGQAVCLKAIRMYRKSEKAKFMRDISKEAVIWAQLDHPNILRMLGIYREKSRICLVSLWMEAGNLVQYLENHPTAPRRHLAMDVSQGLKYLHDNGIVHGDLKGMNVLINDQGVACLADFGLSSLPTVMHTQAMTSSLGTGTILWTAPELFDYDETEDTPPAKPTTASDMYSWACVCYEIFIGKYPFWHIKRPAQTIPLHIKAGGRPQRPHDSHPSWTTYGLNIAIWSIMEDCWTESPDERPEMEYAIAQLKPMLGDDVRDMGSTHETLPPGYFRQHMNGDIDVAVVLSILDRV